MLNHDNSIKDIVNALLSGFSGQQNTLVIPRPYIKLCGGDVVAALLLSQIIYWSDRTSDPDGWFAKSYGDWEDELGLTEYQVRRSMKKLIDLGVEKKLEKSVYYDNAPTLHYRIITDTFSESILKKLQNPYLRNSRIESEETSESIPKKLQNPHSEPSLYIHSPHTEPTTEPTAHAGAADTPVKEAVDEEPSQTPNPKSSEAQLSQTENSGPSGLTNSFEAMAWNEEYREVVREALCLDGVSDKKLRQIGTLLQQKLAMPPIEVKAFGLWYQDRRRREGWSAKTHIRKLETIEQYVNEFRDDDPEAQWLPRAMNTSGGYEWDGDNPIYAPPNPDFNFSALWDNLEWPEKPGGSS